MFKFFKKLWNDERGNVLVIAAAGLPMVAGAAGLATDTIQWTLWKRQLQRAADSAAIAGVYQRAQDAGATTNVATAVNTDLAVNQQTGLSLLTTPTIGTPADVGDFVNQVEVTLSVQQSLPFSSIFMTTAPTIRSYARAAGVPGGDKYIAVALGSSASQEGIKVSGGASLDFGNFGLITNSKASNAAVANSASANVSASVIAAVGDVMETDAWDVDKYDPYTTEFPDPYSSKVFADYSTDMNCTNRKLSAVSSTSGASHNHTFSWADAQIAAGGPYNCFSSVDVGSGTTVNVTTAGPIYVNGGDVNVQGTMNATNGNTIVLTNTSTGTGATIGKFTMNASGKLNINAPSSGYFQGIAIFQDSRASDTGSTKNKVNGNSSSIINGALYFPSTELDYAGTATLGTEVCARFVVKRLVFSGSAGTNAFKQDCSAYGVPDYEGGRSVRLVG